MRVTTCPKCGEDVRYMEGEDEVYCDNCGYCIK
jgi:ribosomal protein S27AE